MNCFSEAKAGWSSPQFLVLRGIPQKADAKNLAQTPAFASSVDS